MVPLIDKPLHNLVRLAHKHRVGVRIGAETQYLPQPRYRQQGWKGWIEVDLSLTTLMSTSLTQRALGTIIAKKVAHELGHFLVAPPGRKYQQDYGIRAYGKRSEKSMEFWDLDEAKATLVEHQLLRHFGFEGRTKLLKDPLCNMRRLSRLRVCRKKAWQWWRSEGKRAFEESLLLK